MKDKIKACVLAFLEGYSGMSAEDLTSIEDGADLMEGGFIDSNGFIELIAHLGEQLGLEYDLTELDPSDLVSIDGLVEHCPGQG